MALGTTVVLVVIYFLVMAVITFTHELGHATAYLLLTRPKKVDVYLGSYGNKKSLKLKAARLTIHFSHPFPFIVKGACVSSKSETDYIKWLAILLAGPLFAVFTAITIAFFIFNYELDGIFQFLAVLLLIFSIWSSFTNLSPSSFTTHNKSLNSDGKNIAFAFKLKRNFKIYIDAIDDMLKKDYSNAAQKFEAIFASAPHEELIRHLTYCYIELKKYTEACDNIERLREITHLNASDYLQLGCIYSFTNQKSLAIENYRLCLAYDPLNIDCLNNIGIELTETGKFKEAEDCLELAIKHKSEYGYLYSMLGYCKILQDKTEEGKQLLDKGMVLSTDYFYAYKALGVYYLKTNQPRQALLEFEKSKQLNNSVNLENYTDEAKRLTESQSLSI